MEVRPAGFEPATLGLGNGRRDGASPATATGSASSPDSVARQLPTEAEIDPDLSRVIDAWPTLPAQLRAAVMALVGTAR
jgi:hypothetical protein